MRYWRHLFTPHHSNNFRAKILHNSSLVILSVLFLILTTAFVYLKSTHPAVLGISYSITQGELLQDTNAMRVENGLSSLNMDEELNVAAREKAQYMLSHNFWAHFAPDGTTPWSFIKNSGYDYVYAGENLAKGFSSSGDIVKAWMNSPSHRENILSTKYRDVGFAVVEGTLLGENTVLVVQMFGSKSSIVSQAPQETSQKISSQQEVVPTLIPTAVPQVKAETEKKVLKVQSQDLVQRPVINAKNTTKSITIAFLLFIIGVLAIDIIIVEKKKIPRIVGHNLDHIILLLLFLIYAVLSKSGGIL